MRKSRTTKVTLRFRMLNTGKETLYLDYYPGVPNPKNGEIMRREYLGMYVVPLKKRTGEPLTNKDGSYKYNEDDKETIRLAEIIRNNRQNELSSRPLKSGLIVDYKRYNSVNALINLQVFVSLDIKTCRFL